MIEVDFNSGVGHEPAKRRPAIVVTSYAFNVRSLLVGVAPIQSKDTGYPLHVPVDEAGLHGYACVEQVRNIDVERSWYRLIGYASDSLMRQVACIIRGVYGLR